MVVDRVLRKHYSWELDSRLRGNDGVVLGNDNSLRRNDGLVRGNDGAPEAGH